MAMNVRVVVAAYDSTPDSASFCPRRVLDVRHPFLRREDFQPRALSSVRNTIYMGTTGSALRGDPRGARLVVLHQRAHGVLGGLLRLPQACRALPGCDLQHPSPGEIWGLLGMVYTYLRSDSIPCAG